MITSMDSLHTFDTYIQSLSTSLKISYQNRQQNVLLFQNCQHNVSVFPASMFQVQYLLCLMKQDA